ncbi:hypothetical protein [Salinilacihabitans rarus]|uniref:hypothetical protein n=1 Tax=Salinilacihabitans rarus TaxID=2961596 RepID=UPI0020C89B36|nr:hypothetical protein [Salinilacihabitans rarus]
MRARLSLVVDWVSETGPNDPVFDSLLLTGPLVVALVVVLGRSPITTAVAAAYVGFFAAYVPYKALQ